MLVVQVADRVGLSQTACSMCVHNFEAAGAIGRRIAIVPPEMIGLGLCVWFILQYSGLPAAVLHRGA